ncbi:hypothetical protein J3459_015864 [Metarhizium acridum]|uniref:Uncharacterized protein n=1 Tax=Metarhizium acridum (strain CQMa 102) TaxID=655827 RepID=E9E9L6_METAQ|nr:uncharacterized protein MAC_06564 [Metarhizium acridum CQMa 102]EFY87329.1 hypothetical protein MAC_06564 [Metarhizium acridum CQMa 102]KAG8411389.1 hypothetical protein J3458_015449 [Metarhizium acridum]KAG8412650.1 hypothetical protein J3459_015864 [Metarhizium acridum]
MPSSATIKAKEKYEAMLAAAKGDGVSHMPNRVVATRLPSTGGCEMTNSITRRSSQSSDASRAGRFRTMIRNMLSPPAY